MPAALRPQGWGRAVGFGMGGYGECGGSFGVLRRAAVGVRGGSFGMFGGELLGCAMRSSGDVPWGLAQCRSTQRWGLRLTKKSLQGSQTHPLPAATSAVCRGTLWACSGQVQGGTSPPLWSPRGQGVPDRAVVPCTAVTPVLTALGSALPRAHRHHPNAGSRAPPFESFLIAEVEGGGGEKRKSSLRIAPKTSCAPAGVWGALRGGGSCRARLCPWGKPGRGRGVPAKGQSCQSMEVLHRARGVSPAAVWAQHWDSGFWVPGRTALGFW